MRSAVQSARKGTNRGEPNQSELRRSAQCGRGEPEPVEKENHKPEPQQKRKTRSGVIAVIRTPRARKNQERRRKLIGAVVRYEEERARAIARIATGGAVCKPRRRTRRCAARRRQNYRSQTSERQPVVTQQAGIGNVATQRQRRMRENAPAKVRAQCRVTCIIRVVAR